MKFYECDDKKINQLNIEVIDELKKLDESRPTRKELESIDKEQIKKAEELLNLQLLSDLVKLMYGGLCEKKSYEQMIIDSNKDYYDFVYKYDSKIEILDSKDSFDIDDEKWKEWLDYLKKPAINNFIRYITENKITKQKIIIKDDKVYNYLLSGYINSLYFNALYSDVNKWFDYSCLIIHYIKAVESLLYNKLYNKHLLSYYEVKHITLNGLIDKTKNYKEKLFNKGIPSFVLDYYFNLLDRYRKVYRNGYFHKDKLSIDTYMNINSISIMIIELSVLIYKNR